MKREETYAELNGHREEVNADLRLDLLAAGDTGEVDVAGLDKSLGTLSSLEKLLRESVTKLPSEFAPFMLDLSDGAYL